MSDLDNLIVDFKVNMAKTAEFVTGNDTHDVQTPTGFVPSLAKIAKQANDTVAALLPDISNRLRIDASIDYPVTFQEFARRNLGLDKVGNIEPALLPISEAVAGALQDLVTDIDTRELAANKNRANGYAGLVGTKLAIPNSLGTLLSYFYHTNATSRNWQMQDSDGTVAFLSDITGNNTGTNTGDETKNSILQKLELDEISGVNTGDETLERLLEKLGLSEISGVNTGDETADSIIAKVGAPLLVGARGAIDGVAPLGADRIIPEQYLPTAFKSVEVLNTLADIPETGVLERLYIVIENTGLYYYNQVMFVQLNVPLTDTDQLQEGQNSLYFTALRVLQTVMTNLNITDVSQVAATDTLLTAIGKLQGQVIDRELLANKAVDFNVVNHVLYPTTKAVKTYMDTRLVSVINDRGGWDASTGLWPTTGGSKEDGTIKKGDLWYVTTPGQLGGVTVNVGDSFRALMDLPGADAAKWSVLESNIGYVPYNATNPSGFTQNQTDAFLVSRANHTGTQSALTIVETVSRVFVTAGEKIDITHANRTALDLVSGTNTGDETKSSILTKVGTDPVALSTTGSVKFNDAANVNATYFITFGDGVNAQTTLKSDSELNYNPSTNTLNAGTFNGKALTTNGTAATAQATVGLGMVASDAVRGTTVVGNGSSADVSLTDRNLVTRLGVTVKGVVVVGTLDSSRGTDIPSAAALNLNSATGNALDVTGAVAITSVALADGALRWVRFAGSLTLTHSANLVLPTSLNIVTAPGDYALFIGRPSGVVHCAFYARATGAPLVGGLLDKARSIVANTAATTVDLNTGDQAVVFKVSVAANTTLTFSNPPTPTNGELFSFTLIITNDATAGRGLAFGNTIKWAGGYLPPRTTTANAVDVWTFFVDNGVYYGSLAITDAK